MRGSAGPPLIEAWMNVLLDYTPYAALHTGVPSPDDPTATEVVGGWYSRRRMYWDPLDETAVANSSPLQWTGMPAIAIAGIALYTSATGAVLLIWAPYTTPVLVSAGGSLTVVAHDLYIEIV